MFIMTFQATSYTTKLPTCNNLQRFLFFNVKLVFLEHSDGFHNDVFVNYIVYFVLEFLNGYHSKNK